MRYIWYPELEIYGLETFGRQSVLKEMSGVRIMKNKTINYELGWGGQHDRSSKNTSKKLFLRVRITISCRMNFDDYPLDAHTCQFQVGSCKSLTQKRITPEVVFISDYDTKDMVTCTAKFIYDLKRQRSLQHFLTIEDLPEQFHTVVIPSGDPCHHHGQVYFDKEHIPWTMYPDQCLMRYLQPVEKNISTEPNGNCSAKVNL